MAISVGSVEVDVIPNTRGIHRKLTRDLVAAGAASGEAAGDAAGQRFGPAMTSAVSNSIGARIGERIGQQIASRITASVRGALRDGITQGGAAARPAATRQGSDTGGAFARAARARIEAAFRSLPKIDVGADTTEADSDLQALRARMEALAGKRIGVDIDAAAARTEIEEIEEELRRLGSAHPDVTVRADTARARAELAEVRAEIDRISARPGHVRLETDGSFGQRLRAAVQQAQASLPEINVDADTSPARAQVASLRAQLATLADKRVGIDIDAAAAAAQIEAIQARLTALASSDADVDVRVDAAAASAQLAAVGAMATALDAKRVNINVSAAQAIAAVLQLGVALGLVAALPALPILAAGLGAVTASAVTAAVGVGALAAVAVPAIIGIAGALQAQKAAQDAAANATARGGQAHAQAAGRALQMAGAQQALASAHRNAARQIEQAEQAVADAVRNSAEANRQAGQQVVQARRALADAIQQAADRQLDAAERVAAAEESLADAQRASQRAQQDLTQARRDAAAELAELGDRLTNARLSERDAALSVQEAQVRLRQVQSAGSRAGLLDQQRAQLAYDQAVQRLKEARAETKELSREKQAADQAGVDGSDQVLAAQQKVAEAEKRIADEQKDLVKARAAAARQQVENQQAIADAQTRVAEAQRNVARTQEDGARAVARAQESLVATQQSAADSIASAQRQIASASLAAAGGVDQAAVAQAKYEQALAKLSPAARATFDAVQDLRTAFSAWSTSLQPQVMPLFTRAVIGLKNSLPGLTPIVEGAARAIGTLQDRVSRGFKSPWWQSFKSDFTSATEPAITGFGTALGQTFKGIAGIIQAFLPHMDSISGHMERITGRFASWGTSLKGSEKFESFLDYSARMGPVVAEAIGDVSSGVYQVGRALEPLSGPVLKTLGALFSGIASVAETLPWLVQGFYLAIIATRLWTIAMFLFNAVANANPISLIILGIVALVAAVVYAWEHFDWFRNGVMAVWEGIQTAASFAWTSVLKPAFEGIWKGLQTVGRWAVWLWDTALKPTWDAISLGAKLLATLVLTILIVPLVLAFKVLAAVGMWLWDKALKPVWDLIAAGASWLWRNWLKPAFDNFMTGLRAIGDAAKWLWDKAVSPVFSWIGDKAQKLWRQWLKPSWDLTKQGLKALGDKVRELWNDYARPVFTWIGDKAKWLWDKAIKPAFDNVKKGVKAVGDAFEDAKDFIGRAWSKVQDIAKKPVRFIIDKIYNGGIVPTWNKIASAFGAPKIRTMRTEGWATGGVLPGYTPGRDVHTFYSPTGGGLELSGGEAIMRPEFTRAVGSGFVNYFNKIATTRGSSGVKKALAPALGGNPAPTQQFAEGGIFSWIGKKVGGAGSAVWDGVKASADWLADTMERSARAGLNLVVDPLLAKFPGADTQLGRMLRRIPSKILDSIFGFSKEADKRGAGGIGGPRIQKALTWARAQAGKPYIWGGVGPTGFDCSGFMSGIQNVIEGRPANVRRWATGAFSGRTAPPGWVLNGKSPFTVGITNAGVGHTAGTLGGVNVESRGGDGVVVGKRARGAASLLFTDVYGLRPGTYDNGGFLEPGFNLAYNGTGRPEPVLTGAQFNALAAGRAGGVAQFEGDLYLDSGEWLGRVRGEAASVVEQNNRELTQILRSGRKR
ncbi:hypothetical protein [Streptomyces sp. C10-9-1]|uniref:hypothetical protein n=1 Tax=Streptomyces sp. C10-9-1 TaxID=1859285 RepID=UPI003F49CD28